MKIPSQQEKSDTFALLHTNGEAFAIPNPWDAGSAVILQDAGFKALATTSVGFAQSIGKADGEVTLEEVKKVLDSVSWLVNILAVFMPDVTLAQYSELGVARVSIGGALAGKIRKATVAAASKMIETGRFD